jgi:hypothetical protein
MQQRTQRPFMGLGSLLHQIRVVHREIALLSSSYAAYCMQGQTGAEYGPCLLSAHYSGLTGGYGQGVNPGVTSTIHPGTSVPGPSFHTPSRPKIYEEGPLFYSDRQGSAYAIPPQVLPCDYTSQVPATVSDKVLCDSGGNQNAGTYPSSAPAEQWDAQVSWRYTFWLALSPKLFLIPIFTTQAAMFCPASYIPVQPPCVAPSPLKNKIAVSPESPITRGNVIWDTRWNQDMGTYPAHPAQRDAQVAWRSTLHRPELFMTLYLSCRRP